MPVTYGNGNPNADGYLSGLAIPTTSSLMGQLRDVLVQAGQNVNDTDIAANKLAAEGDDNGDKCVFRWEVRNVSANEKELTCRGDFDGTETSLSPELIIPYWEGDQSRLYLSVDEAGGCILPLNSSHLSRSIHFGFPERLTNNPGMWMLGYLDQWMTNAFFAEDIYNVRWREIKSYYYATAETETAISGPYQNLWDSLTVSITSGINYVTSTNKNNPAYKPWLGAVDAVTGLPILRQYGYLVGKSAYNQYAVPNQNTQEEKAIPLHFPGAVRFARTGLASTNAGEQFTDQETGIKVISGGLAGLYQGFKIAG